MKIVANLNRTIIRDEETIPFQSFRLRAALLWTQF